jgi:hypothetical protein
MTVGDTQRQGIAMTEPLQDVNEARRVLAHFASLYPGQLFYLENSLNPQSSGITVTWIPDWYIPLYLSRRVLSSFEPIAPTGLGLTE